MNEDTIGLLTACEAGVQMATGAIDGVMKDVQSDAMRRTLTESLRRHQALGDQARTLLAQDGQAAPEPSAMAKGMSWLKTNWTLLRNPGDAGAAELVTGGCDMGVRTLARERNHRPAASNEARSIAAELMGLERELSSQLAQYL